MRCVIHLEDGTEVYCSDFTGLKIEPTSERVIEIQLLRQGVREEFLTSIRYETHEEMMFSIHNITEQLKGILENHKDVRTLVI